MYLLIEIIFDAINVDIELHRESKNCYFVFEYNDRASGQEIEDFIKSTPYYSDRLKECLLKTGDLSIIVSKDWLNKSYDITWVWAQSHEWLFYYVKYILIPSLNKSPDRVELDLPEWY